MTEELLLRKKDVIAVRSLLGPNFENLCWNGCFLSAAGKFMPIQDVVLGAEPAKCCVVGAFVWHKRQDPVLIVLNNLQPLVNAFEPPFRRAADYDFERDKRIRPYAVISSMMTMSDFLGTEAIDRYFSRLLEYSPE